MSHKNCRAIYSVEVEFSSSGKPCIGEINFTPELAEEFTEEKHLYNQAFKYLFLNENDENLVKM